TLARGGTGGAGAALARALEPRHLTRAPAAALWGPEPRGPAAGTRSARLRIEPRDGLPRGPPTGALLRPILPVRAGTGRAAEPVGRSRHLTANLGSRSDGAAVHGDGRGVEQAQRDARVTVADGAPRVLLGAAVYICSPRPTLGPRAR